MRRTVLTIFAGISTLLYAQVEIEPFAPVVPATYIGDFDFLSPGDDIPSSSTYAEEGDLGGPDNAWVCDDGSVIAGFTGGIGNWAAGTCELGDELYLVSPEMDFGTATSSTTLTFRYIIDDGAHIGFPGFFGDVNLQVYYKTSAGGSWNLLSTYTTVDNAWHTVAVDLDGAASYSSYYLGFRMYGVMAGSTVSWGFMGLDEIVVTGVDGGGCSDSFSSFTVTDCFSYTVPSGDETYTVSGTYNDTIPNASGCDSILTIDATVVTPDVGVTLSGGTLSADASGVSYQWLQCPAMTAVAGETNQDFTPAADGDYAVIITDGACVDTSACQTVAGSGLSAAVPSVFTIYPNPAQELVFIEWSNDFKFAHIELYSADGRTFLVRSEIDDNVVSVDISALSPGIYAVRIFNQDGQYTSDFLVKE